MTESRFILFFQILISLFFATILFYPNLSAQWGLADDHEIVSFMGTDLHLRYSEIPEMLMKTEAGFPGWSLRYRFTFYLIRLLETATWGNNPSFWYAFRIFLFGISIFIGWRLLSRPFGPIGGLCCMVLISHRFWGDVFCRLGASEAYAVIGLAFYCLAFANLWSQENQERENLWWVVLSLSACLAMGSKENFLILLPASAVLVYHRHRFRRLNRICILMNIILFGFGLFLFAAIFVALGKQGTDFYANPVTPTARFLVFKSGLLSLAHWKVQLPFLVSLVLLIIMTIYRKSRPNHEFIWQVRHEIKFLCWAEAILLLLWYSQFVFYNGVWPHGGRYDFPGVLAGDLAYLLFAYLLIRLMRWRFRTQQVLYALLGGTIVLWIVLVGFSEFRAINGYAQFNRTRTNLFTQSLLRIVEETKRSPDIPIVFESHDVWDYEPIYSLRRFLSTYGVKNRLALKLEGYTEGAHKNRIEVVLEASLKNLSRKGERGNTTLATPELPFYPVEDIPEKAECFVVSFSGDTETPCRDLGRIW
jgi:hypothetical protein